MKRNLSILTTSKPYKSICVAIVFMFVSMLCACDFMNNSKTGSIEDAQQQFISEVQYMTEKDALANEINYYKEPQITVYRKVRDLTGKDAIHECNLLEKENIEKENALRNGQVSVIRTWNCFQEKQYAVDHPDDIVGAEYYFEGIFTHYNNGYDTRKAKVLCINGKWFVIKKY